MDSLLTAAAVASTDSSLQFFRRRCELTWLIVPCCPNEQAKREFIVASHLTSQDWQTESLSWCLLYFLLLNQQVSIFCVCVNILLNLLYFGKFWFWFYRIRYRNVSASLPCTRSSTVKLKPRAMHSASLRLVKTATLFSRCRTCSSL